MRHGLQSVGERAEETTERIINTTAEWTGTGNHFPSTLSSTSRYGHISGSTLAQRPSAASHYQEEHKQHSPIHSQHCSLNGASGAGGGGGLGFMTDWLQRHDDVDEVDGAADGSYYRERSWNDSAFGKQCTIQ